MHKRDEQQDRRRDTASRHNIARQKISLSHDCALVCCLLNVRNSLQGSKIYSSSSPNVRSFVSLIQQWVRVCHCALRHLLPTSTTHDAMAPIDHMLLLCGRWSTRLYTAEAHGDNLDSAVDLHPHRNRCHFRMCRIRRRPFNYLLNGNKKLSCRDVQFQRRIMACP